MKNKITIGNPTYNRGHKALFGVETILNKLPVGVDILIVDNDFQLQYESYFKISNISKSHTRTKTKNPQPNDITERFQKIMYNEFYAWGFRRKLYKSLGQSQTDVVIWVDSYNEKRPQTGEQCLGKTPWQTFICLKPLTFDNWLDRIMPTTTVAE